MDLNNYRGITLSDVVGKVFGKVVNSRLETWYRDLLAEEQAGFPKGRGCVDQGYTGSSILRDWKNRRRPTCGPEEGIRQCI